MLRGKALRDAFILRLLAAERFIRGVLLVALAYGVYKFNGAQDSLEQVFKEYLPTLKPFADKLGIDLQNTGPVKLIQKALDRPAQHARAGRDRRARVRRPRAARGHRSVADEAVGRVRRDGRHRCVHPARDLRARRAGRPGYASSAFAFNVFAVVYLLWTKRLFGFRGGRAAFEAERHSESLLEVEQAAA